MSDYDVKELQRALLAHGWDCGPVDGEFGSKTKRAVRAFQEQQGWRGAEADGIPGPETLQRLGVHPSVIVAPADGEPGPNYRHTYYGGHTVNERTAVLLKRAASAFGHSLNLIQGSYHKGVSASAGTHDGGGVVDVNVSGYTVAQQWLIVRALRQAGFAAWRRTPTEGFDYHIHACAIGDREMASLARSQVHAYFAGRNGLAGNGPDSAPASVGRPYPKWAAKYK